MSTVEEIAHRHSSPTFLQCFNVVSFSEAAEQISGQMPSSDSSFWLS